MTPSVTMPEQLSREDCVRIVLSASPTVTNTELGRRIGMSREAVRQIRIGKMYRSILPDLPREERDHRGRRCWHCRLANSHRPPRGGSDREQMQWCSLDYPEAVDPRYAIECPSFSSQHPHDSDLSGADRKKPRPLGFTLTS